MAEPREGQGVRAPGWTWFLSSRVARQIFQLFVACALLPLLLFAGLALHNVTEQLESQAEARLHGECKALGRTLLERLSVLRDDLRMLSSGSSSADLENQLDLAGPLAGPLAERAEQRFSWIALGTRDSRLLEASRSDVVLPALAPDALDHLDRAGALMAFEETSDGSTSLVLTVAMEGGEPGRLLFGRVRGTFLWDVEDVVDPAHGLLVLADDGRLLFSAGERAASLVEHVREALRVDAASGQFEHGESATARLASYRTVFARPQLWRNLVIAQDQAYGEVVAPVESFKHIFLLFSVFTFLGVVLASLVQIRRSLVPIETLLEATERVWEHDFSTRVDIVTRDEFQTLGKSFNRMAEGLERYVDTMEELHRIAIALTAERSSDRLVETIGAGTERITGANLVLLHLFDDEGNPRLAHVCGPADHDLGQASNDLERATLVERCLASNGTVSIEGAQASPEARSGLGVPMRDHEGKMIGVLELWNDAEPESGSARPFSEEQRLLAESLASQAAVALTKNRLVDDFKNLFEALSELIATAIDEKSDYTGEHCRRVPLLTMMIAEEVCAAQGGAFANFRFTGDQLYELKVAALLHDCGKVVTPVHVVDKATKLETITDRIELVATRFEVARRDLELAWLREALEASGAECEGSERLAAEVAALEDDLAVVRRSNIGGEWMPPEDRARVRAIAAERLWTGPDGRTQPLLTDDEVENLCVTKGTLTDAEREIINYHVVATVKMLEKLPYPAHLARVPEIAGAHHERMDGKGYPLGLRRGQIALQGRILGIADVFEALTAKDRPYKPGKTLTETLTILGNMKEEGHIDPDLFQLFVDSGLWLRYAEAHLGEEQVDEVDLDAIPGYDRGAGLRRAS